MSSGSFLDSLAPSGSRATVENSETAIREPVFFRADVKALNAVRTSPAELPTDPDSSRTMWMSIPHAVFRFGFGIGDGGSPGAARAASATARARRTTSNPTGKRMSRRGSFTDRRFFRKELVHP